MVSPIKCRKPTGVDIAVIAPPPLTNATQNVAVHIAGYLLLKVPASDCAECSEQLILPRLPPPFQEMSFYTFVHEKTYKEEGSLVLSTLTMANFVEYLKAMFCAIFEGIIHMSFVLNRLCKSAEEYSKFLSCKQEKCFVRIRSMVNCK